MDTCEIMEEYGTSLLMECLQLSACVFECGLQISWWRSTGMKKEALLLLGTVMYSNVVRADYTVCRLQYYTSAVHYSGRVSMLSVFFPSCFHLLLLFSCACTWLITCRHIYFYECSVAWILIYSARFDRWPLSI